MVLAGAIENAKEACRELVGQLADLVEEQGRAVRLTDEARPLRHPVARVVRGVAEELGLDEP